MIIFELLGKIENVETIATGARIRDVAKGIGRVRFLDGSEWLAELHWYEAHGIGKKEMKVKRLLN